jgi:hypothetical protein
VDHGGRNAPLDESVEAVATGLAPELSQTPLAGGSREPKRQNQGNDTARTLEKPSKPPKKSKTTEVLPANEHAQHGQKRTISGQNSGDIFVGKTTVIAEEPAPARKRQNCGDIHVPEKIVEATDENQIRELLYKQELAKLKLTPKLLELAAELGTEFEPKFEPELGTELGTDLGTETSTEMPNQFTDLRPDNLDSSPTNQI